MRDNAEKLRDIMEAIARIERYAFESRKSFEGNELLQTWFLYNLQVIGEASRALSAEFREQHPEIPWTEIIGMRNILVHNYFEVDLDIVWFAIQRNVPQLKSQVEAILQNMGETY
ncbi:HepT-like ribonuclease domain-containing protein [Dapis sp. BLCC M229]|uniref:HepT-like ribonuclease domain-containing protein n=1 Tax=Dapis sp. BLCC M229 TaxID=3400188 RepID=UPI003CED5F9B